MRMTVCEVHEKQANNLGKTHVSFSCPFCLIDSSVKAESQLALAREGLEECIYWLDEDRVSPEFWTLKYREFRERLAKLAETKEEK